MNWYKKAKLADKNPEPNAPILLTCQFCKRWLAEEGWKKQSELMPDEIAQMETETEKIKSGISRGGISHSICPYCMDMIEKTEYPNSQEEINELTNKSLSLM